MKIRISILLVFACLLTSCIKERQMGADLSVGDYIPDFTITMNDGTSITSEQLSEGVGCIVFFTTLCPDCRKTLAHIQRIYDEYVSQGVSIVLISREEGEASIEEHWFENGYNMPYSAQKDRIIYELFAATRVPRVYICSNGIIRQIFTDSPIPTYEALKEALDGVVR